MNAIEAKETPDMAKAPQAAEAAADTAPEKTPAQIEAEAIAAQLAEDERIKAAQDAEEAQLKAEAEALRQAEDDGAAEDVPALSLEISEETALTGKELLDWLTEQPRKLLFGAGGRAIDVPAPWVRAPMHWRDEAGLIVWAGDFSVLIDETGRRVTADSVALADGPDGPVRAVSALGGLVQFAPGSEFKFGPGAFVF
jgi:hypothetical protein